MARPKKYGTEEERRAANAARQTAFRGRVRIVDRAALDRLHDRLDQLQAAVADAARAGDPVARAGQAVSAETLLDRLAAYFTQAAGPRRPGDGGGSPKL